MIIDEEDYIQHHGVLGMKWGIRHDPKELAAKRDKKAQKYINEAARYDAKVKQARAGRSIFRGHQIRSNSEKRNQALRDAHATRRGDLTDKQRKIVIGSSAAATTAAAYGTYHSLNSGNARRLAMNGKAWLTGDDTDAPWTKNPNLSRPGMTEDEILNEVVQHVNPDFGSPGTRNNCKRATYAYEMRRRGYDVAATKTTNGLGQDQTGSYNALNPGINLVPPGTTGMITRAVAESRKSEQPFTDYANSRSKEPNQYSGELKFENGIGDTLSKMPPGARGELSMVWHGGGGHSMSWENVNGNVVVFDNQTGKKYSTQSELDELGTSIAKVGGTRLDNRPLNHDFLKRWVKNA